MSDRTLKLTSPLMRGSDVERFQRDVNAELARWDIDFAVDVDGVYGPATRDTARSVCHGLGLASPVMAHGATPAVRLKVRNRKLSKAELARFKSREDWRDALERRLEGPDDVIREALEWAAAQIGTKESPPGSNSGPKIDGWQRACGVSHAPWCGCFANAFLVRAGFADQPWLRYCPWIESNARSGYGDWSWSATANVGALVLYGASIAEHVGVVETVVNGRQDKSIEGNTTGGPGGPQSDGGMVARRDRLEDGSLVGFPIRGYAIPPWRKVA